MIAKELKFSRKESHLDSSVIEWNTVTAARKRRILLEFEAPLPVLNEREDDGGKQSAKADTGSVPVNDGRSVREATSEGWTTGAMRELYREREGAGSSL